MATSLILLCTMFLLCHGIWPQQSLGQNGLDYAVLPTPKGTGSIPLARTTLCQTIDVPADYFVVTSIGAVSSSINPVSRLQYTLSLYSSSGLLLAQNSSMWQPGTNNVLRLPGQVLLRPGTAFICLTSVNTSAVQLATEASTGPQYYFTGPNVPANITAVMNDFLNGPTASLYVVGTPAMITQFPHNETFDDWPLCGGCSIVNGPCAAQNGWSNPSGDDFDWSVNAGPTTSRALGRPTGPLYDHTMQNATGRYIYSEQSIPCGAQGGQREHVALLQTPVLAISRGWYLRLDFWMHKYGRDTQIHYDVSFDGGATFVLDAAPVHEGNMGDAWLHYIVDVSAAVYLHCEDQGAVVRIRSVSGNTTEWSFEGDVAIDDVTIDAYTRTPSATATPTASATPTQTLTTVPTFTSTSTVVPTTTPSATATATPLRGYIPIGIPDPRSIVRAPWASVSPTIVVVKEISHLQLAGHWLYRPNTVVDVKFAVWAQNCLDIAPNTTVVTLDRFNVATIQAPFVAGQYLLCIRHRQDWEDVAVIDVVPEDPGRVIYGYTSCEQFLRFQQQYCGCWLQKGDPASYTSPTHTLTLSAPHWQLFPGNQTVLYEQGCCMRGTKVRTELFDEVLQLNWGMCEDHATRGQLGDYSCPAQPPEV